MQIDSRTRGFKFRTAHWAALLLEWQSYRNSFAVTKWLFGTIVLTEEEPGNLVKLFHICVKRRTTQGTTRSKCAAANQAIARIPLSTLLSLGHLPPGGKACGLCPLSKCRGRPISSTIQSFLPYLQNNSSGVRCFARGEIALDFLPAIRYN